MYGCMPWNYIKRSQASSLVRSMDSGEFRDIKVGPWACTHITTLDASRLDSNAMHQIQLASADGRCVWDWVDGRGWPDEWTLDWAFMHGRWRCVEYFFHDFLCLIFHSLKLFASHWTPIMPLVSFERHYTLCPTRWCVSSLLVVHKLIRWTISHLAYIHLASTNEYDSPSCKHPMPSTTMSHQWKPRKIAYKCREPKRRVWWSVVGCPFWVLGTGAVPLCVKSQPAHHHQHTSLDGQ
jgi:hypothetical protein